MPPRITELAATEISEHDPGDFESRLDVAKLHTALAVFNVRAMHYPNRNRSSTGRLKTLITCGTSGRKMQKSNTPRR